MSYKKDTPKEAVCTVFEKVNTGEVVLNVFELLTATFAADDYRLNQDWDERMARISQFPVLQGVERGFPSSCDTIGNALTKR